MGWNAIKINQTNSFAMEKWSIFKQGKAGLNLVFLLDWLPNQG